ncbi:transglycosylase domain-containing protein [Phenylobacterium sp.]|uniref:transglycosylase domain-containing protein n=1 Tax=Phenylobacterium sp. TaxID=1871053 RepID=UPI0027328CA9|nr:penicillin-binding protein 1A [Phenylobacterium sp.]MDP3635420.1 penicillin-binding protein 1A [Phenylobacterium sp.]MDZ4055326.1 penicillin-binding protein 1A [Phenylobacterium sp.]
MANAQSPRRAPRTPAQAVLYWSAVIGVWGLIFLVAFFAVFAVDLPDTSKLYDVKRQPSISYLDRSGALVAVRGSQYAPPVDLDKLPPYVPKAFIAIEDRWFYWHWGFNPWGILRSTIYNVTHTGGPLRGGSTITQQLARNLFLTANQTYRRKAQELILAVWLEAKFSKKEILSLYLNRVYFGAGAYGIEAAAQRYFNKPASQLTIGESALLAGMMKGPSRYSPVSATDRAARRATIVLDEMVRTRAITPEQRAEAFKTPVRVNPVLANQRAQYFTDWVDDQVRSLVGEPTEDLVVETTLDLPIQTAAEQALRRGVTGSKAQGVGQGALVAIDGEGRIRAYVGGSSYADSQFDRATMAQRQAGSSFKPFVYLAAMEQGRTPATPVVDEPVKIGTWEPKNYTGRFLGPMSLQTALAQSINTVAARLANEVGTGNVAATARRLGITSHIQLDPSMALGAVEVSPMDMAQAYAPFSNGGYLAKGYGIERIRTASGKVLYDHGMDRSARRSVIGSPALQYMNQMMRQVITSGTGTKARVAGFDIAGKTGTTSDYRDAWFVGYTGGFVTAVWVGRDDNTPMKGVTGGGAPAGIWRDFMTAALPRLKTQAIPGGTMAPPPVQAPAPASDPIGDLLSGDGPGAGPPPERQPAEDIPF